MINPRKPFLPPGTKWMLRSMESSNNHRWLEVWGWGIQWGDAPSHCCPIFTNENIKDDYHWSLFTRFTSEEAVKEIKVCALAEVVTSKAGGFEATGRIRPHPRIPECAGGLVWSELNRWRRGQNVDRIGGNEAGKQAMDILRRILKSDRIMYWSLSSEADDKLPEFAEAEQLLKRYDRPPKKIPLYEAARKEVLASK